jgi:hypothetical protein
VGLRVPFAVWVAVALAWASPASAQTSGAPATKPDGDSAAPSRAERSDPAGEASEGPGDPSTATPGVRAEGDRRAPTPSEAARTGVRAPHRAHGLTSSEPSLLRSRRLWLGVGGGVVFVAVLTTVGMLLGGTSE